MRVLGISRWSRLVGTGLVVGGMTLASVVVASTTAGASHSQASGTITCSKGTGTVKFTPPLTNTPARVRMTISFKPTHCVVTPSGASGRVVPLTANYNSSKSNVYLTGGCSELMGSTGVSSKWKVSWAKPKAPPTVVTFSGFEGTTNVNGDFGLSYPEAGGTGTATGSYAESGATQQLVFNMTPAQISTACASPSGFPDNGVENANGTY